MSFCGKHSIQLYVFIGHIWKLYSLVNVNTINININMMKFKSNYIEQAKHSICNSFRCYIMQFFKFRTVEKLS